MGKLPGYLMNTLARFFSRLSSVMGGAALMLMTLMIIVDIFLRTFLNQSLGFVEEVTGYLVVAITFFGVSITFRENALFRVSFLYDKIPSGLKSIIDSVYLIISIIFCCTMLWFTSLLVWSSFVRGKIAATELQTPIYLPQILIPLGFLIIIIFALDKLFNRENLNVVDGHVLSVNDSTGE